MKRMAVIFALGMLLCATAHAEKARFVVTQEDSRYHERHLEQHIGSSGVSCTGNYVKVRSKAGGNRVVGHLEIADSFCLLDVKNGWAQIKVESSAETSPDSFNGMTGWMNADYIDCGCSEEQYYGLGLSAASVREEGAYDDVLDMFCRAITERWDWEKIDEMGFELDVFVGSLEKDGFILRDLNHDGTDELVILPKSCIGSDTGGEQGQIVAVYALSAGKPVCVLSGWNRNRHYLCKDGGIYNEGSDGAAYWTVCILDIVGTKSVVREGVQTDYIFEGDEAVKIWHRMTEEKRMYDGDIISEDEANADLNRYSQMLLDDSAGFVSFAEYLRTK